MGKGNRWAELFGLCFSLSTATSSCSRSLLGIRKERRKPLFFCSSHRNFTYGKRPWLGKSPTTHTYTPRVFAYYLLSIFLFGICVFLICYLGFSYLALAVGLEPTTRKLEIFCSVPLSYASIYLPPPPLVLEDCFKEGEGLAPEPPLANCFQ